MSKSNLMVAVPDELHVVAVSPGREGAGEGVRWDTAGRVDLGPYLTLFAVVRGITCTGKLTKDNYKWNRWVRVPSGKKVSSLTCILHWIPTKNKDIFMQKLIHLLELALT